MCVCACACVHTHMYTHVYYWLFFSESLFLLQNMANLADPQFKCYRSKDTQNSTVFQYQFKFPGENLTGALGHVYNPDPINFG